MLAYSVLILAACLAIVPVGKLNFPGLADADQVSLRVMESEFPPVIRGIAVAAVLAAVMSTTDALLLACSSAIAHDLLGDVLRERSQRTRAVIGVVSAWVVGAIALLWAFSPPELILGLLYRGRRHSQRELVRPHDRGAVVESANVTGGVTALVTGALVYVVVQLIDFGLSPILVALPASAIAMVGGSLVGSPEKQEMLDSIAALHHAPS